MSAPTARVLTNVRAVDRTFDYSVPAAMAGTLRVGTTVWVPFGPRRVRGWVVDLDAPPPEGIELVDVARRRGWGPEPEVLDLAAWAAHRWAGPQSPLLTVASPDTAMATLPPADRRPPPPPRATSRAGAATADLVAAALAAPTDEPSVVRLPPAAELTGLVAAVAQSGPTLVVAPSLGGAATLARGLRRAGAGVALLPDDWGRARAGAAVVIGARAAAWGPCPGLRAVVILDAHDEDLHHEANPTWDAVTVGVERARRAGVPCLLVSSCPTLSLLATASPSVLVPPRRIEREGWAPLRVVDRRDDDPRLGLFSAPLVDLVRATTRVACVLNRTGRAQLVGCRACGALARCERCGAALGEASVGEGGPRSLACPRCDLQRPWVCAECGSSALRRLRLGVTRAAEELGALARRPVASLTASAPDPPPGTEVVVGTEAVLRRGARWDAVAFLDLDGDLLAPRFRAAEEGLALLARASRAVGGRHRGGSVLVQTRIPDHPVIAAAFLADPTRATDAEDEVRRTLSLPPYAALATVSGDGAGAVADGLAGRLGVTVSGPSDGTWLVRAPTADALADALAEVGRPGGLARIHVDPVRI